MPEPPDNPIILPTEFPVETPEQALFWKDVYDAWGYLVESYSWGWGKVQEGISQAAAAANSAIMQAYYDQIESNNRHLRGGQQLIYEADGVVRREIQIPINIVQQDYSGILARIIDEVYDIQLSVNSRFKQVLDFIGSGVQQTVSAVSDGLKTISDYISEQTSNTVKAVEQAITDIFAGLLAAIAALLEQIPRKVWQYLDKYLTEEITL